MNAELNAKKLIDVAYSVNGATVRGVVLKDMDEFLRQHCADEDMFDCWLMVGVPDGSSTSDCVDIAENDADYFDIVKEFEKIISRKDFIWC